MTFVWPFQLATCGVSSRLSGNAAALDLTLDDVVMLDSAATSGVDIAVPTLSPLTARFDIAVLPRLARHHAGLLSTLGDWSGNGIAHGLRGRGRERQSGQEAEADEGREGERSEHGFAILM